MSIEVGQPPVIPKSEGNGCKFQPKPDEPAPAPAPWAVANGILLIPILTLVSWWMIRVTGWFEESLTLLSLGGVLSWIAVLLKAIPESRSKGWHETFFDHVLNNWIFTSLIIALFLFWLLLTAFLGSVEVQVTEAESDRRVTVASTIQPTDEPDYIGKGAHERYVFWTVPFRSRHVVVNVEGYPDKTVAVRPWQCEQLRTPDSMLREVLLLRPKMSFLAKYKGVNVQLAVTTRSGTYHGRWPGSAVWVGCRDGVVVPRATELRWTVEVKPEHRDWVKLFWLSQKAFRDDQGNFVPPLAPGEDVKVEWIAPGGKRATTNPTVQSVTREDFPQVVELSE